MHFSTRTAPDAFKSLAQTAVARSVGAAQTEAAQPERDWNCVTWRNAEGRKLTLSDAFQNVVQYR